MINDERIMKPMLHGGMSIPKIAIIDSNTLAAMGMQSLINSIMPSVAVEAYNSFNELQANHPEQFFHYFVAINILLEHYDFFVENRRKTIVMTTSPEPEKHLDKFHSFCVSASEKELVKSLLSLEQGAHPGGKRMPLPPADKNVHKILSDREIEVLTLIVKGYINKQIAEMLNVSLPTIVTHRRNITDKLNRKSVASLTIYAVMHGYVSINEI